MDHTGYSDAPRTRSQAASIVTSTATGLWTASALIAERTLVDFERGARNPLGRTLLDVRRALEDAGVIFIDADEEGPGVRLKADRPGQ